MSTPPTGGGQRGADRHVIDLAIAGYSPGREIGRGGFGTVYLARDLELNREVAIKILAANALDGDRRERFDRERRSLGALAAHPNIITVYATGYTERGNPYLVMEYAPGGSVADLINTAGPRPWQEAISRSVSLCGAVASAHSSQILHRDIKPDNVLLSEYGDPKLCDFGIAGLLASGASTTTDKVSLSIAHTSPEILEGERQTAYSDIYALGSSAFTEIYGSPPFRRVGDTAIAVMIRRILVEQVPDLRPLGVPPPVCEVIEKSMRKQPGERFSTAEEFGEALREAQLACNVTATPMRIAVRRASAPTDPQALAADPAADGDTTGERVTPALSPTVDLGRRAAIPTPEDAPAADPVARRRRVLIALGAVTALASLGGATLAMSGDAESTPTAERLAAAVSTPPSSVAAAAADMVAAPTVTTAPATTAPATTGVPIPASSLVISPEAFLGITIDRTWTLDAAQSEVAVALTLTNSSGLDLRWHHDESVPVAVADSPSLVVSDPPGETPEMITRDPVVRYWFELAAGEQATYTYRIARNAAWPTVITDEVLGQWEQARQAADRARRAYILGFYETTDATQPLPDATVPTTTQPPAPTTSRPRTPATPATPAAPVTPVAPATPVDPPAPATPVDPPVAAPSPTIVVSGTTARVGQSLTFSVSSWTGGVTWNWGNGRTTSGNNVPYSWPTAGTYTVTATLAGSSTPFASVVITVNPGLPTVSIGGSSTVVAGQSFVWPVTSSNAVSGVWSSPCGVANNSSWSPGGSWSGSYSNTGTCTITLTVSNSIGEQASTTKTFTVVAA